MAYKYKTDIKDDINLREKQSNLPTSHQCFPHQYDES